MRKRVERWEYGVAVEALGLRGVCRAVGRKLRGVEVFCTRCMDNLPEDVKAALDVRVTYAAAFHEALLFLEELFSVEDRTERKKGAGSLNGAFQGGGNLN